MDLKNVLFASDVCSTSMALAANSFLQYLIKRKTPEDLRPYAKILRQKSFVDTFFAIIIAITFIEMEVSHSAYVFFQQGVLKKLPHPWNGMLCILYLWAMYFCISADFIPFYYRYLLIVKGRKMTTKEFYALYIITGLLASIIAIGAYVSFWPSTLGEGRVIYLEILGDFWKDYNGSYPIYISSRFPNPYLIAVVIYAFFLVFGAYSLIAYFGFYTLKHLKENQFVMSEKTRKLQRNLTLTFVVQITCAPMFSAVIPIIFALFTMFFNLGIKHVGPILISSINWVVVLNPISVIILVAPYRNAALCRQRKFLKYTILKWKNYMDRNNAIADTVNMNGLELNSNRVG